MAKKNANLADRLPPHSIEAEQCVLGCVLLSPADGLELCIGALVHGGAEFYDLRHQTIYAAMRELYEARSAVDVLTVQQRLKDQQNLEAVGGLAYLAALPDATPSAVNLPAYLEILREKHALRRWLAVSADIALTCYEEGPSKDLVARMSGAVFGLCEGQQVNREKTMPEVIADVQEQYLDKFRRGHKHKIGPTTGFNYVDNIIPGFGKGELIVLAARPRTGKSAMMMQVIEHMALVEKVPVAMFSLEMTAAGLGAREIFQKGGADFTKFLNGFMSEEDMQKLVSASVTLSAMPVVIDDSPSMCIEDLEIRSRRLKRQRNIGAVFIDYVQLLWVRERHERWNTNDEMAHISKRLKGLARELQIPVIIAAQMNREIEKETHRRPRLSDLRDTGQLEQDADIIMFLWKPDVSTEKMQKKIKRILPRMPVQEEWRAEGNWKKNLAMVTCTVEKQRNGRSGEDADLMFIKPWTRFVDAWRPGDDEPKQATMATESDDEI